MYLIQKASAMQFNTLPFISSLKSPLLSHRLQLSSLQFYSLQLLCQSASKFSRATIFMADRDRPQQIQVHPQKQLYSHEGGGKGYSASQLLAIITLLPVSGTLLCLAGLTLAGSLIGLAVATPLFVIFSPVLVPAVILIGGATTAFLTSGAFGLTGLSSLSWVLNSFRQATGREPLDYAKKRMQEDMVQLGERTKQTGETTKNKAQEGGRGGAAART